MRIEGVVLPAVIHNSSYFLVNLPVYADGLVDAWDLLDLPLFEAKVRSGWVCTHVPDGASIHVHGLGAWEVTRGQWQLGPDDLLELVGRKLRELNPELRNLYNCHGTTTKKVGKVNVSVLGMPRATPTRPSDLSPVSPPSRGKSLSVFVRERDAVYIADLRVFDDQHFEIGRIPTPLTLTYDELRAAVDERRILSDPEVGTLTKIHGLGEFSLGPKGWATDIHEIVRELDDISSELRGRPTSIQRCRDAFELYLREPTLENQARLEDAYESVPEHNRRYIGDIDTKDIPVRMIIYGDAEIEGWSHRVVARRGGIDPLPSITVPKPVDER
jgi:hypothetical protein